MNIPPASRFSCILLAAAALLAAGPLAAQTASPSGLWRDADEKTVLSAHRDMTVAAARNGVVPSEYRTLHLDRAMLARMLATAPREFTGSTTTLELELPVPQSTDFVKFKVEESPVMQEGLAARYPEIRTYVAHAVDNPAVSARLDLTPAGFHAMIFSPGGQVFIDPYFADGSDAGTAIAYYKRDYFADRPFHCDVRRTPHPAAKEAAATEAKTARRPTGASLRTYRLALAATAEYTAAVGGGSVDSSGNFITAGTVSKALAAMVTTVNRVDGVYEHEFAIRMVLVNNTDKLIYTNPSTDPYSNDDADSMLDQNQANVDKIIGDANYDIGHVFSTGGGGLSDLGCVCASGYKAQSVTGSPTPKGDSFDIDYVAHEMGHEFGADHCFNSTVGSCGDGNRTAADAYEPGSGTTIMCYAGLCSSGKSVQDLAAHSDAYFHTVSYDEIDTYTSSAPGKNAFSTTATGNTPPAVATPVSYTIPASTPFALTASATDADGDALTYCWEEFDLGPAVNATTQAGEDNGSSPIFRSYAPTASPTRVFPAPQYILNYANVPPLLNASGFLSGEILPSVARANGLNFRCTVRDNHAGGGGSTYVSVRLNVATGAGPFAVTAPNTAVTYTGGSTQAVTWSTAGTAAAPVSCASVRISLSTDSGLTFPYVLARSVPNNGSASVLLPNLPASTTTARIKVEAVGNIFFDVSDANFTLNASASAGKTPAITTQPASASVAVGGNATFSVGASGSATLAFQWYKSGTAISGATASSYSVAGATAASAGAYTVEVSNAYGTVTSAAATLSVSSAAHPNFFSGEAALSNGVYYLVFKDNVPFGYYSYAYFPYLYHFDIGFVYYIAANDVAGGAYLYDFTSKSWWYTSPGLYPYIYDFTLNSWLYYYPNANDKTHYTTSPRYFYNFNTKQIITR